MKKFNLLLSYSDYTPNASLETWFQDEDVLREFDPKWNEPQRQKINGGVFNSKGKYCLDWDIREDKGHARFKERNNKVYGLLEKGIGKKFDNIYSKLCRSGLANKRLWWGSVREEFLSAFEDGRFPGDYYVDDNGLIQRRNNHKRIKIHKDIRIPYEKPIITYKVNHSNLESVANSFILEFGVNTYYHLLYTNEIGESEYTKYLGKWSPTSCRKVMEASRRSRAWKPRYYTLGLEENLFRFIFDKRYECYKKIIKYGTKEYIEYKRNQKRKKKSVNYLTCSQRLYYDAVMRWRKKFGTFSLVNFEANYNNVFCNEKLPPDERRKSSGKPRWDS